MLTPFERGFVAHLIADWLLQNDWMATYKVNLRHPAAWTHAAIHAVFLSLVLGWQAGLVLAVIHMLVDTRMPASWWQNVIVQTKKGQIALILKVAVDQVFHIVPIAVWIELTGRLGT
jgi:hypothetical protein